MKFSTLVLVTFGSNALAFSPRSNDIKATKTQATSVADNEPIRQPIFDPLGLYPTNSHERRFGMISALEQPLEKDETVIDPLSLYKDESQVTRDVEMSPSLPFLKRPEHLDGSLPGDRGFDPFNFASDPSAMAWYRDSEIKHARLAMLAAVGWPLAELAHKSIATRFDLDPVLGIGGRVPTVLNGGLGLTNPLFWVSAISAAAALEFVATKNGDSREPGDFGFDPLSLAGTNGQQSVFVREAEIFNGRLAMLAITGFVAQEFYTNTAVVNQTPIFFKPFSDVVAHFLGAGGGSI
ncbi:unnamed protein product [Pseudo-nitzschia multistriata]|uniref:Plastid light harvesting protein n=1 Tax=Pseudo-nitzschia multistriata TaxID=183589 RepID=A0A448Z6I6_9STRA|nr:unnamed protein product [Pseudo-nitzschia multistriata]